MARNNNLSDFLSDVASAIRTKKGTSGDIAAQSFPEEILSIETGGSFSIVQITQAAYNALTTKDPNTIYLIIG